MTIDVELVASDTAVDIVPDGNVLDPAADDPAAASSLDAVPFMPPARPPVFGAGKAFAAFVFLLLAQVVAAVAVIMVGTIVALIRGQNIADPAFASRLTADNSALLLIAAGIASTLAVFATARFWAWHIVRDKSSNGIGMTAAPRIQILFWSGVGVLLSVLYLVTVLWIVPFDPSTPVGPLAAAASGGLLNRIAFAILALLFAPFVEEFFFRGLLLKGFSTSWGTKAGSIVVTVLFVLLHLGETYNYWPATLFVTLMACSTLAARRLTGSLAPAIALHGSYNLVIVLVVFVKPFIS
jgi:membrane protease YdiL (CAAX protease family)